VDAILAAVGPDKKAEAGRVPFILPTAIWKATIRPDVRQGEIRQALRVMVGREAFAGLDEHVRVARR
jgi:hypothetical protein